MYIIYMETVAFVQTILRYVLHIQPLFISHDNVKISQFMNKNKDKLVWNAVPTLFDFPNPPPFLVGKGPPPNPKQPISTSGIYEIPEDFVNYKKYSIAGGDLCVKNGVVPHIFNYQLPRTLTHVKECQTNFTSSSDTELLHSPLSSNCVKDLVDKVTVKNSPGVEIQQYDTNADPEPTWLSLEVKTIKEESKDSPSSVFNHYDGCNEEINHENQDKDSLCNPLTPYCEIDLVDWSGTTIKKEPDAEIDQNSSEAASSSHWLSFEVKSIKQENEDSVNGVLKNCEAYPQEFDEHEDVDEAHEKSVIFSLVCHGKKNLELSEYVGEKLRSRSSKNNCLSYVSHDNVQTSSIHFLEISEFLIFVSNKLR
ncbi:hypothetical protein GQR58_020958 [Nymphon striatum]|nr:hypothetical protein GQR58_020958 [Nymphon striatum]